MTKLKAALGCIAILIGLLGLEWHWATTSPAPALAATPEPAAPAPPHSVASPDPAQLAQMEATILARPLFTPGRRPAPPLATGSAMPRLAGLILAPETRLALLQPASEATDAPDTRPRLLRKNDAIAGWRLVSIDATGVLLRRAGQFVHLTPKAAGARPVPPTPIEKIVMMPQKRINPQLAW